MVRRLPAVLLAVLAVCAVVLLATRGADDTHDLDTDDAPTGDVAARNEDDAPLLQGGGRPRPADRRTPIAEPPPPVAPKRYVTGRVVDRGGRPSGHAQVWWNAPMPAGGSTRADARGRFVLPADDLDAGTHVLRARGPGTGTAEQDVDLHAVPGETSVGDVMLPEGLHIHGLVVDRTGKPVPYVRVRAWSEVEGAVGEMFAGGTRILFGGDDVATDESGAFHLAGLDPEPHRVWVDLTLSGVWNAKPAAFTGVWPGGDPLTFVLVGRTRVRGVVIDAVHGTPITRFVIHGRLFEDPSGRFDVRLQPSQALEVRARGYRDHRRDDMSLREGESANALTVGMDPNPNVGTLVIRAMDAAGEPVTGWEVSGFGPEWFGWLERCRDASGVVRVAGLVPGHNMFRVRGDGLAHAQGAAVIVRGGEVEHTVVLERGGRVRLRVVAPDGAPARYAKLTVLDGDGKPRYWHFTYSRAQGTAIVTREIAGTAGRLAEADGTLSGLPAGRYTVRIEGRGKVMERPIDVPREGEIEIELRE